MDKGILQREHEGSSPSIKTLFHPGMTHSTAGINNLVTLVRELIEWLFPALWLISWSLFILYRSHCLLFVIINERQDAARTEVRSLTRTRIQIPAVRSCHSPAAAVVAAAVVAAAADHKHQQRSNPETTGQSSLLQENVNYTPSIINKHIH